MSKQSNSAKTKQKELVIIRDFNTSRELVWKALTDPEWVKSWWGPKNYTAPAIQIDLKVGGKYLYCMRSREGKDYWSTGVYRKIVPHKKLVFTDSFADEKGNVVSPVSYGMSRDFPLETLTTMVLEDEEGKARLTLSLTSPPSEKDRHAAEIGWNESLDKLTKFLQKAKTEIKSQSDNIGSRPPGALSYHSA